ncbi:hypothetical protein PHMEG_00027982 [Phytophthora megakarya]|uniref:Uncharacterized protein n=1 Tax=Phytophthora megakarya TaxID=4795 RepID=A0A225V8L6_9STRA|nr:hypothetical protein PHMEG_00027982 [Phytophthora megakarya]
MTSRARWRKLKKLAEDYFVGEKELMKYLDKLDLGMDMKVTLVPVFALF